MPRQVSTSVQPSRILIVDDEEAVCSFLAVALGDRHSVTTCFTGAQAMALIRENRFDIVVTDLRLPDVSGIDILRFAKEQDEFVEVIMITGFASLDSAARATNLGVASYLVKPLSLDEFGRQLDRAISLRSFHVKSLRLMEQSETMSKEARDHFYDITALYHFSRKMMVSLELPEVLNVILDDTNERMNAAMSVIAVNFLEFAEVFAMPHTGTIRPDDVRRVLLDAWSPAFDFLDKAAFQRRDLPLAVLDGRKGEAPDLSGLHEVCLPMEARGQTIGTLVLYAKEPIGPDGGSYQFLNVYTSLISAIVEHAYIDMQAQLLAKTDGLTGIANFRLFTESLAREISRADRRGGAFSLALIDIDDFKSVNDTYGHVVGDRVLKDLTKRITSLVRRGDLLARYGGEEFALILPDTPVEGASRLAERIRHEVADQPFTDARVRATISVGVAHYDGSLPHDREQLIQEADRALYKSKRNGKNLVTVFSGDA